MPDDAPRPPQSERSASPPESAGVEPAELTPEELAEARHYRRLSLAASLVDMGLDLVYLAVAAVVLAKPLDDWLQGFPILDRHASLRLPVFTLAIFLLHFAISFPLSFYSGYWLEHRFKLSKLSVSGWLRRYLKQAALTIGFSIALFLGLYWIIWIAGPSWWLVAAVAFFLVSVLLGQLAPVLIMPLFYTIERLENSDLADRLIRLAEGTGLAIEGVYRIALSEETVKGNAFLAGLGRTRRVLIGDTLLAGFTTEEIEVIFAHEVGHHVFGHIRKQIVIGVLYSLLAFWICDALLRLRVGGPAGAVDYAQLPVSVLPILLLALRVLSIVLEPLQNAIARRFERQCDGYALERTGLRAAFVSAFRKLARLNKDDPDPPWLEVVLFHSHPPIGQRVAMALGPDPS